MQVRTTNLGGSLDDFFNQFKASPAAIQNLSDTEKKAAIESGIFPNTYATIPTGQQVAGTKMQNTADLNFDLRIDPSRTNLPGVINFTSPVIPDFLKAATTMNTTTKVPSPGAVALALQTTPWYKNKNTLMMVGGAAVVAAALFVFTGNKSTGGQKRK